MTARLIGRVVAKYSILAELLTYNLVPLLCMSITVCNWQGMHAAFVIIPQCTPTSSRLLRVFLPWKNRRVIRAFQQPQELSMHIETPNLRELEV